MAPIAIDVPWGSARLKMNLELDESRLNVKPILDFLRTGNLYEPDVANLFVKALCEGDVAVDVGANIG
jgi:hypothetical protein